MKSISIPFRFSKGAIATTDDNSTIARQRIADVLATRAYERVNRPEYGAGIHNLLFEDIDPLVFSDYKIDALDMLNRNVSNARIRDIMIKEGNSIMYGNDGATTIIATVVYDVANTGTATFTVTLDPTTIFTEETRF